MERVKDAWHHALKQVMDSRMRKMLEEKEENTERTDEEQTIKYGDEGSFNKWKSKVESDVEKIRQKLTEIPTEIANRMRQTEDDDCVMIESETEESTEVVEYEGIETTEKEKGLMNLVKGIAGEETAQIEKNGNQ